DRAPHRLSRGQQAGRLLRVGVGERDRRQVFQDAAGTPPVAQVVVDLQAGTEQRPSGRVAPVGCQQAQLLKGPRYAFAEADSLGQGAALLQERGRLLTVSLLTSDGAQAEERPCDALHVIDVTEYL